MTLLVCAHGSNCFNDSGANKVPFLITRDSQVATIQVNLSSFFLDGGNQASNSVFGKGANKRASEWK
jgi:hypothetical protein